MKNKNTLFKTLFLKNINIKIKIACIFLSFNLLITFLLYTPIFKQTKIISSDSSNINDNDSHNLDSSDILKNILENEDFKKINNIKDKDNIPQNAGKIVEQLYTYKEGGAYLKNNGQGLIKNTAQIDPNLISQIISQKPNFKIELNSKNPQVLIVHTHTTESFERYDLSYYDPSVKTRSNDSSINVLSIGEAIIGELNNQGINAIQAREIHDKEYSKAYDLSRDTIKKYLSQYPSIKVVIDVHRDAIQTADGTRYKPTATINNKKAAQIMMITGVTGKGVVLNNYPENLKFSSGLQNQIESMYKNLTRPILFDNRHYNQDLAPANVLIEFGSQANTISEVIYSGQLVGKALSEYLKTLV